MSIPCFEHARLRFRLIGWLRDRDTRGDDWSMRRVVLAVAGLTSPLTAAAPPALWNRVWVFPTGSRIVREIHFQDGVYQISGAYV